jgi:hypothetical protein
VGEGQCDPDRLGLWGSSFSGGHVVYVAARGRAQKEALAWFDEHLKK